MPTALETVVSALRMLQIHDVTPTLEEGMPGWPEHPPLEIQTEARTHAVHGYAAQTLVISEHTGAHVDAPFHFHPGTATIDEVPPDALLRPFKKYDLSDAGARPGELIGLEHLKAAEQAAGFALEAGDIAVLEFGWDAHVADADNWWGRNEPGLTEQACAYLASAGVAAVASDTAGCDVAERDGDVVCGHGHTDHFLPNGILIVEGLRGLAAVPSSGLFMALPLKIKNGSGSPIRVLLLTEES